MILLKAICYFAAAFSFVESTGLPPTTDWQSYKTFYRKIYANSVSETKHEKNFQQNVLRVEAHNAKYEDGNVTYTLELNEFSDQDPETFSSTMNGYVKMEDLNETAPFFLAPQIDPQASSFDWRSQNKVSPVKSQGSCGSCWAFSAVGALESQILIKGEGSTTLSEQQLVDCDRSNKGCGGGDEGRAFEYIRKTGIQSDKDYPYKGKGGRGCKFDSSKVALRVNGVKRVRSDAIIQTLETVGPLSAAMDANKLQQYRKGIYKCSSRPQLNHAVLIVGHASDHWIVKNSWGKGWGENGYVKITKSSGSDCGITKDVVYATI